MSEQITDAETFTREQMLAEVDRRVERALFAQAALAARPAPTAPEDDTTSEDRIENAKQAMAETHSSWESRCHAIMNALGIDAGGPTVLPDEERTRAEKAEAEVERLRKERDALRHEVGKHMDRSIAETAIRGANKRAEAAETRAALLERELSRRGDE